MRSLFRKNPDAEKPDAQQLLNNVRIASPCPVSWESMDGDDLTRFCGQCQLNVYNIKGLTAEDAVELIREKQGKVCIQLYRRSDGSVLTEDCPEGFHRMRRDFMKKAAVFLAAISFLPGQKASAQSQAGLADEGRCVLRGEAEATSVKPILDSKPVQNQSQKVSKKGCEGASCWRLPMGLALAGLAVVSFKLVKKKQALWILGLCLGLLFAAIGYSWM